MFHPSPERFAAEAKRERDLGELRDRRRLTVPVLAALGGIATSAAVDVTVTAGVGFTVSLLIASRAFDGAPLDQAKVGILVTALLAPLLAVVALRRRQVTVVMTPCVAR